MSKPEWRSFVTNVLDFVDRLLGRKPISDSSLKIWLGSSSGRKMREILFAVRAGGHEGLYSGPMDNAHTMLQAAKLIEHNPCSGPDEYQWRCTEKGEEIADIMRKRFLGETP